jgi:THAP4-like, heme-binding beta-barrel domain
MTKLHPELAFAEALLGTWRGRGHGEYPTIEPFDYVESITFDHIGKPFLAYTQRTRAEGSAGQPGPPMHAEMGYWRFPAPGRIELVVSHPTGVSEVSTGTVVLEVDGALSVEIETTQVACTPTAKAVTRIARSFTFRGDELHYVVRMAAVGLPLQHHLEARLTRVPDLSSSA